MHRLLDYSADERGITLKDTGTILVLERGDTMATDPVCLMIVEEDDAKFTSTYRNQKYFFCCNYCKKQFEDNPRRYSRLGIDARVDINGGCS